MAFSLKSLRGAHVFVAAVVFGFASPTYLSAQNDRLTPLQHRIHLQQQRLSSSIAEERRDALMKLGAMKHPEASRAALAGLNDAEPVVRITAVHALAALPASDASSALIPLLADKQEVVRREAAHALGTTRNRNAAQPLIGLLTTDKIPEVRAAAARSGADDAIGRLPSGYATQLALFFLGCVVVAGIYGGFTANKRIWLLQALPAGVALLAVIFA